ncbi:MAG: RNA methyltransferase [Smithella sp.]
MLYIVLLHYPVYNREGRIVTTAIANMDIHDIARVAKTYAVQGFYIVNPIAEQRRMAQEIVRHWLDGYGASFNEDRRTAFELIHVRENLQGVIDDIGAKEMCLPKMIVTGANFSGEVVRFNQLKRILQNDHSPYLLVFGTGSGIAEEICKLADYRLEPIEGVVDYNHMSVRSAVAIILDRLTGVN